MLLLVIRAVLAATFFVAAFGKFRDLPGSRQAAGNFGVPAPFAPTVAVVVPAAEAALGVGLLTHRVAWIAACGSTLLLAAFIGAVGVAVRRGGGFDCHCFGALRSTPVGKATLARNGVLFALALGVVSAGPRRVGPSLVTAVTDARPVQVAVTATLVALAAVAATEGWLLLGLLRDHGRLILRVEALEAAGARPIAAAPQPNPHLHPAPAEVPVPLPPPGLEPGTPAPDFSLDSLAGGRVSLADVRVEGVPTVLVFSDPGCGPCVALAPEIAFWQRHHSAALTVTVISRGKAKDNRAKASQTGLGTVLLQKDRELADSYAVTGTPSAVLIDTDGAVVRTAVGPDDIRDLVAWTGSGPELLPVIAHPPRPAKIGDPAPAFILPDLEGTAVSSGEFAGSNVALLFWDAHCGYCVNMLDRVRQWRPEAGGQVQRLVVVAAGSADAVRAQQFPCTVLIDAGGAVSRLYQSPGTPTAVSIDPLGRLGSDPQVGSAAVMALLGEATVTTGIAV